MVPQGLAREAGPLSFLGVVSRCVIGSVTTLQALQDAGLDQTVQCFYTVWLRRQHLFLKRCLPSNHAF
jgi:hypothetical protein